MDQRLLVAQRRVVDGRDVPGEVVAEPQRQRDRRVRQQPPQPERAAAAGHRAARSRAPRAAAPTRRGSRSGAGAPRAGSAARGDGSGVQNATASSAIEPAKQAIRQRGAPVAARPRRGRGATSTGTTTRRVDVGLPRVRRMLCASSTARYPRRRPRGCSSMVELQPSKLVTRVRFPPPASGYQARLRFSAGVRERLELVRVQADRRLPPMRLHLARERKRFARLAAARARS